MTEQLPERMSTAARTRARLLRHVEWARKDGVARLVEEDRLDPRERASEAIARWRWRRAEGLPAGHGKAVLVVGVQRSGTNMLTRGLESMPEVEVHNENDSAVFERFQLRSSDALVRTVAASPHRVVLFKPICDSHDTDRLLDVLAEQPATAQPPQALWAFRGVDDRVRSAVAKFGGVNQRILADIASGTAGDIWQSRRLDAEALEQIRAQDPATLSAESGAALFWWMRNRLYFSTGLDSRPDVMPVEYERVVADPEGEMARVCAAIGLPMSNRAHAHIDQRSVTSRPPLELHPGVRALCDDLGRRLSAAAAQWQPTA